METTKKAERMQGGCRQGTVRGEEGRQAGETIKKVVQAGYLERIRGWVFLRSATPRRRRGQGLRSPCGTHLGGVQGIGPQRQPRTVHAAQHRGELHQVAPQLRLAGRVQLGDPP